MKHSAKRRGAKGRGAAGAKVKTRKWYAWLNMEPPPPDDLHAIGEVRVANPGVEAYLTYHTPQGFNPNILLLDLHLVQRPGFWPQVLTWVQARYDRTLHPTEARYTNVTVLYGGAAVASMKVKQIH